MSYNTRLRVIAMVMGLVGALVIMQVLRIQTGINGQMLRAQAKDAEYYEKVVYPERGNIYDRWGRLLAGNREVYIVGINLAVENRDNETIARESARLLGLDYNEVLKQAQTPYERGKSVFVQLKDFVDPDTIIQLEAAQKNYLDLAEKTPPKNGQRAASMRGMEWSPHLTRIYPESLLGANVLGFCAMDGTPHHGIEEKYQDMLAGTPVEIKIAVEPSKITDVPTVPPGTSLVLTLDREIQDMTEKIIDRTVQENKAESGTIIVYDPRSGEVMAMAVTPRIDPNRYWVPNEKIKAPTYNRAVDLTYEPGSVFKVISMSSAIDAGIVTPDTEFIDTGMVEVGGRKIYNWDRRAWGPQTMTGCMRHSLNVCLASVAIQLKAGPFYEYMRAFGIGHRSNIDLADETVLPLKVPGDSSWYEVNLGTNSFGQGLAVAPIQLVAAVGALANNGAMMVPHMLKATINNGQRVEYPARVAGHPITEKTAQTMTEMLAISLEEEASNALVPGYRVAGKTGTAEIPTDQGYTSDMTNASFVGWGPVDDPRFLVYIWLEKPDRKWGSIVAAPIFSEVVRNLVILMDLPPDETRLSFYGQQ